MTNRVTYENTANWLKEARHHSSENVEFILIGNKLDLANREVSFEEASIFAKENNLEYMETTAKDYALVE